MSKVVIKVRIEIDEEFMAKVEASTNATSDEMLIKTLAILTQKLGGLDE